MSGEPYSSEPAGRGSLASRSTESISCCRPAGSSLRKAAAALSACSVQVTVCAGGLLGVIEREREVVFEIGGSVRGGERRVLRLIESGHLRAERCSGVWRINGDVGVVKVVKGSPTRGKGTGSWRTYVAATRRWPPRSPRLSGPTLRWRKPSDGWLRRWALGSSRSGPCSKWSGPARLRPMDRNRPLASLAHETACTLRDIGDLAGATSQFHHSVRTCKAAFPSVTGSSARCRLGRCCCWCPGHVAGGGCRG